MKRAAVWLGWLAVGLLSLFCCGNGFLIVFQVPFTLAFGWVEYLIVVVPKVRVNPAGVGLFAIAVPIAAALAHHSCRWLYDDASRRWRWKWTWLGMAVVLLMFASGIAATGVVHQAGWLLRSPGPLTISSWEARVDAASARCEANLRKIATALAAYEAANGGRRPADQAELVRAVASQGGQPDWFVCGDERFPIAKPATREAGWVDRVAQGDDHFTYRYFAEPIVGPDGKRRVRMCDRQMHYYGGFIGFVLLYDSGEIEILDNEASRAWLKDGFALNPSFDRVERPARPRSAETP